jgi:RNA polymerase sigma factor for flagellar operon FliA
MVDPRELLVSNLALIERVVAFVCRRQHLRPEEVEEFGAVVRLKLVEDDYAVIRKFEGRSTFATFITIVIQRMLLDFRIHHLGKWHPSAEAKRRGEVAVELEKMISRDGKNFDEAFATLSWKHPTLSRQELDEIAKALPQRPPRKTFVPLDDTEHVAAPDSPVAHHESARASAAISSIVREFIDGLQSNERLLLQLRFESGMQVAAIARSLHLDQKQLYRTIEKRLRELRSLLERHGISEDVASDVIGNRGVVLDFRLGAQASHGEEVSS